MNSVSLDDGPEPNDRKISHFQLARRLGRALLTTLSVVVGLTNCGEDDCQSGESRCDGARIVSCGTPGDITGSRGFTAVSSGCGVAKCLDIRDGNLRVAVCSTSGAPDPRCKDHNNAFCLERNKLLGCFHGYSAFEETCSGTCVANPKGGGSPFCSIETLPNKLCDERNGLECDGTSLVQCHFEYVTKRTECAANSTALCVQSSSTFRRAYCAKSNACSELDNAPCDGPASIGGCVAGHVVATKCTGGAACEEFTAVSSNGASRIFRESECVKR